MRKVVGVMLMLALVVMAQYMAWRQRSDVTMIAGRLAGNPILHYQAVGQSRGVVLIAHGYAANKELMRPWGYYLAQQGFDAYLLDQPGHGDSTVPLPDWDGPDGNPLGDNLRAMIDDLIAKKQAEEGRIALVGHSMGGAAVTAAALADDRIRATVAISSAYTDALPENRPANLLSLVAERDPVFVVNAYKAQSAQAVVGTGRQFAVIDGRNHMTVLYDAGAMARASAWLRASFGEAATAPAATAGFGWTWVWLALASGLGLVAACTALLAPGKGGRRNPRAQSRVGLLTAVVMLAVAALSAVLAAVYIRIPWLGLSVADYLLPYFLVMAAVLLVLRLVWPRDFGYAVVVDQDAEGGLLRGCGVFLGFMGGVAPIVHMNLSNYMPTLGRILPMLVLAAGLWLYFAQEEGLKRAVSNDLGPWAGALVGVAGKLAIVATWLGASALPNPQPFLPLTIPVALGLLLLVEFFSYLMSRLRFPATGAATFGALVMAWSLAVTMPLM